MLLDNDDDLLFLSMMKHPKWLNLSLPERNSRPNFLHIIETSNGDMDSLPLQLLGTEYTPRAINLPYSNKFKVSNNKNLPVFQPPYYTMPGL